MMPPVGVGTLIAARMLLLLSGQVDAAALGGGVVGGLEVLHVLDAVPEAEAGLVDFAADQADELLLDLPGAVVLLRDRRRLEGLIAGPAGEDRVAPLAVDDGALRAVELDAA